MGNNSPRLVEYVFKAIISLDKYSRSAACHLIDLLEHEQALGDNCPLRQSHRVAIYKHDQ